MTDRNMNDAIDAGLNLLDKDRSEPYTFLVRAFAGPSLAMAVEPLDNNAGILMGVLQKKGLSGQDLVQGLGEIFNRLADPAHRYNTRLGNVLSLNDGSHAQILSLVPAA